MFDDRLGSTFRENGKVPASVALAASQQVAESQMKIARELRAARAEQSDRDTSRNDVDRQLEARDEVKREAVAEPERPVEERPTDGEVENSIDILV